MFEPFDLDLRNCEVDTNVEEIDHDKMLKDNLLENLSDLFEEDNHLVPDNLEWKNYDSNRIDLGDQVESLRGFFGQSNSFEFDCS